MNGTERRLLDCVYFLFQILIISDQFQSYYSHRESDLVNFNDVRARIATITPNYVQYIGTETTLNVSSFDEGFGYVATFINLTTGCGIFQNSSRAFLGKECLQNEETLPIELIYGPMGDNGFWGLENIVEFVAEDRSFTLVKTYLIKSSLVNETEVKYSIKKDSKWKFLQIFEWKTDIFVCFETSNRTVVTLRLKTHPENSDAHGTYISSFFVDTSSRASVYFIPSYPEATMYFSQEEGISTFFRSLRLSDVIKKSDEGFQECQKNGKYPSDFFKLAPYVYNLSKQSWSEGDQGDCQYNVSLFKMDKLANCSGFAMKSSELVPGSIEVYWVGFEFNRKMLAYVLMDTRKNETYDLRCDITKCGAENEAFCGGSLSEIQARQNIVSISWNSDDFVLIGWTKNGSKKDSRLLGCAFFESCPLCTLYGGFNCQWDSSECVEKGSIPLEERYPCYSDVPTLERIIQDTRMELKIMLPHKLNRQFGESVSVTLSGQEYSNVEYTEDIYLFKATLMNVTKPFITIWHGKYSMNSSLSISSEQSGSYLFLLGLILSVIFAALFLVGIHFLRDKGVDEEETKSIEGLRVSHASETEVAMTRPTDSGQVSARKLFLAENDESEPNSQPKLEVQSKSKPEPKSQLQSELKSERKSGSKSKPRSEIKLSGF